MSLVLIGTQPWGQLWDPAGNVQAGAQASLTVPGTGLAVTHYANAAGGSPATGPITADSNGRLMRWVEEGSYNITLPSAIGVVVPPAVTYAVQADMDAVEERIDWFHVDTFGAQAGGSAATNATAIQAAITAAAAVDGWVVLGPGQYDYSTGLTWGSKVSMTGQGCDASRLHYTGSGVALTFGSGALLGSPFGVWEHMFLRDFRLSGTGSATGGIRIRGVLRWGIDDVFVSGFTAGYGFLLNGSSFSGRLSGGRAKDCDIGISAKKVGADGSAAEGQAFNAVEICSGFEGQNCRIAVEIGDPAATETTPVVGQGAEIHGCAFQGNTEIGLHNVSGNAINVHSNYFEQNDVADVRQGTVANTLGPVGSSYHHNFIGAKAIGVDIVRGAGAASCTRVHDNSFLEVGTPTAQIGVQVGANATPSGHQVEIINNSMANISTPVSINAAALASTRYVTPLADPGTIASATTLTLPDGGNPLVFISGTTTITSITASWRGRMVTLRFTGVLTVQQGSNLQIAGNFVTASRYALTLICDGTNWLEIARSANL